MGYPSFNDVVKAREKLKQTSYEHWVHEDFFSWQWWFLLAATIIPWVIWFYFRDKKRTFELMTYGLTWSTIATICDVIGGELIYWGYPDKLLPMVPPLFPADISVIPISFMFVYQFTSKFKTYMIGSVLVSATFSYIIEPLFIKGHMFILHHWSHTASFIGFSLLSPLVYALVKKLGNHTVTKKETP